MLLYTTVDITVFSLRFTHSSWKNLWYRWYPSPYKFCSVKFP